MDRKIFEAICEAIIRPLGEDLAARTFLEDQEGKDVLTFSGEWDSALHERYESWRSHAHSVMREEEMLIDRHKIVACLMLAILEDGPLQLTQVNPDGRFQPIVRICNEVLAFQAGMLVLTRFTIEDALESRQSELCERLLEPMCYPESTVSGESYLDQMYRALYHLRLQLQRERSTPEPGSAEIPRRNKRFRGDQFLLLANLVFMLEQYNLFVKSHDQK